MSRKKVIVKRIFKAIGITTRLCLTASIFYFLNNDEYLKAIMVLQLLTFSRIIYFHYKTKKQIKKLKKLFQVKNK